MCNKSKREKWFSKKPCTLTSFLYFEHSKCIPWGLRCSSSGSLISFLSLIRTQLKWQLFRSCSSLSHSKFHHSSMSTFNLFYISFYNLRLSYSFIHLLLLIFCISPLGYNSMKKKICRMVTTVCLGAKIVSDIHGKWSINTFFEKEKW